MFYKASSPLVACTVLNKLKADPYSLSVNILMGSVSFDLSVMDISLSMKYDRDKKYKNDISTHKRRKYV